ncbi:MAG: mechanosensitive ion channel family protein [Dehalococcoidia bacterium]
MREFFTDIDWSKWAENIWTSSARVIVIVLAIYIGLRILQRILEPTIRRAISAQMVGAPAGEVEKRIDTLSHVAYRTVSVVAILGGLITILPEFGVNASALIAGAGLIGLAVGFGAQSLVKDIIAGMFVLIENQYGKGDVVTVAGISGLVEDVNLRRTVLRDLDGTVHSIPNGVPATTSNMTRTFSRVNMQVGVSYSEDLDRVFEVINRTGRELADDAEWKERVLSPPTVLGVDEFGDAGIAVRILGDTAALAQWDVMREFRKRLKKAFDDEGIEIPYLHRALVAAGQPPAASAKPPPPDDAGAR